MHASRSHIGGRSTTKNGHTAASATEHRPSLRKQPRAMAKTQTSSAWKTPPAFPTLPQLLLRDKFVRSTVRILGAGQRHSWRCRHYHHKMGDRYRIRVANDEIGQVIGKQGRTARSLRMILAAVAIKERRRVNLGMVTVER